MIVIRCAKCKAKIIKYKKIGKGKVLRCWLERIQRVYGSFDQQRLTCPKCGNVIGQVIDDHIKMEASAFTYGGRVD